MTAQILNSELTNLIQESKRKNPELRNAAEKSLQDLKGLPSTSETHLAADLCRRPYFITPFLVACGTQNAKFAGSAVVCFQRLAVSSAIPRERLKDVLDAFRECSSLGLDIQLKILQPLPSLLQNYANDLRGELLSSILSLCSSLLNSKNPAVSGTAAATLQQLVISVFDRVVSEDRKSLELPTVAEVPCGDKTIAVRHAAHDAYKVFHDLCLLTEGSKPQYMRFSSITQASGLELIESVLMNHGKIFLSHPEQGHVLRTLLMPLIIRSLSERLSFPITVRVIRVLNILIRQHLTIMPSESEIVLSLLNHMLEPDASPTWKRVLCMEVFRNIYSEPLLVLEIEQQYDEQEGQKSILRDNLATFVRLATEKPALIGLGQHSTSPAGPLVTRDTPPEQAAIEAGAGVGIIGVSAGLAGVPGPGISSQWSTTRSPCMDQLDKSEPPSLPDTYIYSLVLACINGLSESLSKLVLPLTVHNETRAKKKTRVHEIVEQEPPASPGNESSMEERPKTRLSRSQSYRRRTVPVNPLTLEQHPAFDSVRTTAAVITDCWPPVLATCSTFLNAALDADYYRSLVRSIQKFTQVAGLLRLATPRDAFLTTLSKSAVPPNILTASQVPPKTPTAESPRLFSNPKGLLSVDSFVSQASSLSADKGRRGSIEPNAPSLTTRNLLCLRALLNLAIALGPTLEGAWSIIFETLQQADLITSAAGGKSGTRDQRTATVPGNRQGESDIGSSINSEVIAVHSAASRLFESTADFPNDSFIPVLTSLCDLLHPKRVPPVISAATPPTSAPKQHQRRIGSFSALAISTEVQVQDLLFALGKIGDVASLNLARLTSYPAEESGWDVLIKELISIAADAEVPSTARLVAADIVSRVARESATSTISEDIETRNIIQNRVLSALQAMIHALYGEDVDNEATDETDVEVHGVALEALKSILERCGESLTAGWKSVFTIILSVFEDETDIINRQIHELSTEVKDVANLPSSELISIKLGRMAFGSVQLICSDFLASIPHSSILTLIELLYRFCTQGGDVNISLTTITFFWNVSDFLYERSNPALIDGLAAKTIEDINPARVIEAAVKESYIPALWFHLLLCLAAVSIDPRTEIRNGAVHTILRIFDSYGDQLTLSSWNLCIRAIFFWMIGLSLRRQAHLRERESKTKIEDIKSCNETTKIVLDGLTALLAMYLDKIAVAPEFPQLWGTLMGFFTEYLSLRSHALNATVFSSITGILSKIENAQILSPRSLSLVSSIWVEQFPVSESPFEGGNEEAFLAYVQSFREIYRLTEESIDAAAVGSIASNFRHAITNSNGGAYSADIDYLTPVQKQVLDSLSLIRTDLPGIPSTLLALLADFITLPFSTLEADQRGLSNPQAAKRLTFVALAKASMDSLQPLVGSHVGRKELFETGALLKTLKSLALPIHLKYKWRIEGKAPPSWQKATTAFLAILRPTLEKSKKLAISGDIMTNIWDQIVFIAQGITKADIEPSQIITSVRSDEDFDVSSFSTLKDVIIPSLGSPLIPDPIRLAYASSLFRGSLIHKVGAGELFSIEDEPLKDLYKIRFGRTYDPPPSSRSRMAYSCLSELFSLVALRDSKPERIKLAQAAAPYLILRTALSVKAYIADQPLRGRMPQPESQRQELLFVLHRLRKLDSEPRAIPEAPGVKSQTKKHLHRLYPLIVKAAGVAGKDGEILKELALLLEIVGEEFGV